LAAAKSLGQGWDAYLSGLASLIHYTEHTHADLLDLHGVLINVFAVVTTDRKVDRNELRRLVAAGNDLQCALEKIFAQAGDIVLDERTAARAEIENFKKALGEFRLPPAHEKNMSDWLNVIDGWVRSTAGALKAVHTSALQELLTAEDEIAGWYKAGAPAPAAPDSARAPSEYPRLLLDENRPRQEKLGWWDRFQVADGWLAAIARTMVAGCVVGAVILFGAQLAFHNSAESAALAPSTPVASERSDLSAPAYAPAVQVLAPIELRPEAAPPKEPDAATPPAALNSIPQTSEAPVIAPAEAPSEAGAAPEAAVNPMQ
jgi:hypothetical protein